jgi:thiol-disulfide isomerase/thioredoxin
MKTLIQPILAPVAKCPRAAGATRAFLCAAFACLLLHAPFRMASVAAAQTEPLTAEPAAGQSLEERELEIDKQHLRKIYDAMQAYKKKHRDLPNWLSDLFPEFLSDPNVLMSPVELRTGRSALWNYPDPKMRTSYVYEFSQADSHTSDEHGREMSLKEKKMIQMEEYGPVIPLLRCHLHGRVLNLSYSGDIYQTGLFWESDPTTRELMAKLGPGPGPRDARKMRLTVLDAASGQHIPDADIQTSKLIGMSLPLPPRNLKTDSGGQCEINLVSEDQQALGLRLASAGYITQQIEWLDRNIPSEWTAKMQKAIAIGGIVRDPDGKPISGVQLTLTTVQRNAAGAFAEMEAGVVTTDAKGKWTSRSLPQDFKSLTFDLSHPDFRLTQYNTSASDSVAPGEISKADLLSLEATMVMKPAMTVAGVVADEAGKPIAGAKVFFQQSMEEPRNRLATTDGSGQFKFRIMTPGQGTLSVAAEGLSPQSTTVTFDDNTKPIAFKLVHGQPLKARLLDSDQKPIAGATVALLSWGDAPFPKWSTLTDAEGRFSWDSAPAEAAMYSMSKDGYVPLTRSLEPSSGEPADIVLMKEGLISGKVVDAQTKQPLPQFQIIVGRIYNADNVNWERNNPIQGGNGKYSFQNQQYNGGKIRLLVQADGYLPAVSQAFAYSGWFTNDFELKKGNGFAGTVNLPDGKPAAGIQVALLTGEYTMLKDAQLTGAGSNPGEKNVVTTDAEGKFALPLAYGTEAVAVGPPGYAEAKLDELSGNLALTLQPWGRIEGTVRNGRKPAANTSVMIVATTGGGNMHLTYDFDSYRTQTDDKGRFVLTNVPPGKRFLVRLYPMDFNHGWSWSHIEPLEVKSGAVTHVDYGGKGRTIVGKVVSSDPARIADWNSGIHNFGTQTPKPPAPFKTMAEAEAWNNSPEVKQASAQHRYYAIQFNADGSFHIDDVPPGKYDLRLQFNEPDPRNFMNGALIGSLKLEVEVPEMPNGLVDEPLDLGKLDLVLRQVAKLDALAPDFEVKSLDGQPLKLADFRGKYVLLDFWATWCGPCVAELPHLEDTWNAFGANTNFVMISLSLDNDAEAPRSFVLKRGFKWRQGFLGEWSQAKLPDQYGVQGIPSLFLIGPDGRFLAKDMRGPAIRDAVAKALSVR